MEERLMGEMTDREMGSHPETRLEGGKDDDEGVCLDGVWRDFCHRLADVSEILARPEAPNTPLDQAEGLRYLSRLTRAALNMIVDSSDADRPRLVAMCDDKVKFAGNNPDNYDQQIVVAGNREYRIWGKRGTAPYVSLVSQANRYATDGTMAPTGEIEFSQVEFEPDGSFEIIASKEKRRGNWLPMMVDTSLIVIRQVFEDKATQTPAEFHVERIGDRANARPLLTPEAIDARLKATVAWIRGSANTFADWTASFTVSPNRIYEGKDQSFWIRAGGDPHNWYGHFYFDLQPGEALQLEVMPPQNCRMWNCQLNNWWMELLDAVEPRPWVNKAQAVYEPDGRVIIVCADKDPGYGNWINLAGHRQGTGLWRWIDADSHPAPSCRVVKL
jgi:hypothetical protein